MEHILSEEDEQMLKKLKTKIEPDWKRSVSAIGMAVGPDKTYLDILEESKGQDLIFGIKENKLKFLKGNGYAVNYGSKGAGTDILLNALIEVLTGTLKCNVELFSICFKIELKEAIKEVLDRYNIEVVILE